MVGTRLRIVSLGLLQLSLLTSSAGRAQNQLQPAKSYIPRLEKNLKENIIAFWLPRSLDRDHGGYTINFGPLGEPKGPGTKMIVTQARMVWLFSRLARAGYGGKEYLDAAELGYRFLRQKMWDEKSGGFYWEVDPTGERKIQTGKHLYGQSFALYAISEYYLASGRQEALDFAVQIFNLIEGKSHDRVHGGYNEFFLADWTPSTQTSYLGAAPGVKLMNTHLHLLEAMTTFYRASRLPLARERLLELITIQSNTVVRKSLGACTDQYEADWTPRLEGELSRVSYGHDIENIWLLIDACDAAGIPAAPLADLFKTLFAYSMKYGYDSDKGGFFESGRFNQPADRRRKVWWVQAEAIVSALYLHRMTKDAAYFDVFEKSYDFVDKYQVDWEHGEWYPSVTPDGKGVGDKADPWKAGYHNGRAMIECLAILKAMQ